MGNFCLGVREREEASEQVAERSVFIENRGRGISEEKAGSGGGGGSCSPGGCLQGGGLNIFWRGRSSHQVLIICEFISQLHRTSVIQEFQAGVLLCAVGTCGTTFWE